MSLPEMLSSFVTIVNSIGIILVPFAGLTEVTIVPLASFVGAIVVPEPCAQTLFSERRVYIKAFSSPHVI